MVILLMLFTPCFPRAADISSAVAKANSLHLITTLEEFCLSWGYALDFDCVEAFHFDVFGCPSRQASFHFTFSLRLDGGISCRKTSSKDSMTMNLETSAASF